MLARLALGRGEESAARLAFLLSGLAEDVRSMHAAR
jgi:hypothetical protein